MNPSEQQVYMFSTKTVLGVVGIIGLVLLTLGRVAR